MVQSIKGSNLDFTSGHDLRVVRLSSCQTPRSVESLLEDSPSPSAPPPARLLAFSPK